MRSFYIAACILVLFVVLVFSFFVASNRYYPVLVFTGESSVGTWMSGVLLIFSATTSLIIGMRQNSFLWFAITLFFLLLALDERFMFHEQIKEHIIFSLQNPATASRWIYELPVIAGAFAGLFVVYVLRPHMPGASRALLLCAAGLGGLSVIFDILAAGVLLEECFKLIAELLIALALLRKSYPDSSVAGNNS